MLKGGSAPERTTKPAAELASRVITWQRQHGRRGLPWQGQRDPYRVWLSEVMLQQTQVSTVLDYYARFLVRFPNVAALATAPLDDVLALWSGLGYYSRARNPHRCAQVVVAQHGGVFPARSEGLAELPGIGRSTAAAIAAFCFGERVAILDGNVKRVLTRVLGFDGDLALAAQEKKLWALAQDLLPQQDMDAYTQGLMDLGATLCSARQPQCEVCPLAARCVARAQQSTQAYPVKSRRLKRGQRSHALLWLQRGDVWWLIQRPATGVWAGLWSLPEHSSREALQALTAHWPGQGQWLPPVAHALTHFDWMLFPLVWQWPLNVPLEADALAPAGGGLPGRWMTATEALARGLPAPVRKLFLA